MSRGITLFETQRFDALMDSMSSGGIAGHIATAPPTGMYPITNVYWDPATEKMMGEYDDLGEPSATVSSTPPEGRLAITNIYFNPANGRIVGEFENET